VIRVEETLRPRGVPEILDVALESLRRDAGPILAASLLVNAPLAASLLALFHGLSLAVSPATAADLLGPLALLAALLLLARPLAQGTVAALLADRIERGRDPALGPALLTTVRRAIPVVFASVVFWGAALLGGVLYVVPGLLLSATITLAVPAAAVEGRSPFEAIRRSARLLRGHLGRAVGFNAVTLLLYLFAAANAFFAVQGVLLGGRYLLGLRTAYLEAVLVPTNALYASAILLAVHLAIDPWRACALYHLHLDCRVRHEALDLVRAADALRARPRS
jgi:hypothetical protein